MRKIPDMVIRRLSIYLRVLSTLVEKGINLVSSEELGRLSGCPGTQVRKDLAHFGQFGTRGVGYNSTELRSEISKILGTDRRWNVALIGVGHLGTALLVHERFKKHGFDIIVGFDVDKSKVGRKFHGVEIKDVSELKEVMSEKEIRIAIITVPAQSAQAIADLLVDAGVEAILNFAPANLSVPQNVILKNVDLSLELEGLSFFLTHKDFQSFNVAEFAS